MAEVQISRVKIHHEQILTWLILNPDKTQGECAAHFGVTETWLSIIINSDVFQSRWRERRDFMAEHADKNIMGLMREAATKGLGKLIDKIDTSADPEFLLAATDKILNRMGYGPKSGGATVTVTNTTDAAIKWTVVLPLQGTIQNVWNAVAILKDILQSGSWDQPQFHQRGAVT